MKLRTLIATAIAVTLVFAGLYLGLELDPQRPQVGPVAAPHLLDEPRPVAGFHLVDQDGRPFGLESMADRWSLLFFGYTHCPDICPTTLSTLRVAYNKFETLGLAHDTQVVFVSVDPKRDTPAHLKQYVGYFHPQFRAATGGKDSIDLLAGQFGAGYVFDGDTSGPDYIVNHTGDIYAVSPDGRYYARFGMPHEPEALAAGYAAVRNHYDATESVQ